jgi:hypothetical protein
MNGRQGLILFLIFVLLFLLGVIFKLNTDHQTYSYEEMKEDVRRKEVPVERDTHWKPTQNDQEFKKPTDKDTGTTFPGAEQWKPQSPDPFSFEYDPGSYDMKRSHRGNEHPRETRDFLKECGFSVKECQEKWVEVFEGKFETPLAEKELSGEEAKEKPSSAPVMLMRDFVESYLQLSNAKKSYEGNPNNTLKHSASFTECKAVCDDRKQQLFEAVAALQGLRKTSEQSKQLANSKKEELDEALRDLSSLKQNYATTAKEIGDRASAKEKEGKDLKGKK